MNKRLFLLDFLLGILLPFTMAYLALWRIFSTSGFVMYGDLGFPINLPNYLAHIFHAWNWLYSSPNGPISYISVLGFAIPYWLGLQDTFAEKVWIFLNYTMVGAFMYFAMRIILPNRLNKFPSLLASAVASIGYMVNMYTLALLHLPNVLLPYALFPFAIAYFVKTIDRKVNAVKGSIIIALVLSILVTFTQLFIVTLGIFALYLVYHSLCSKEKLSSFISGVKRSLLILIIFTPLNVYWLPSILIQMPFSPLTTPMMGSFAIDTFGAERGYGMGFDTLKVLTLNVGFGIVLPITSMTLATGLALPLMSFFCLLFLRRHKGLAERTLFFAILSILGLLLSTRTPPFDILTMSIAKYVFSSGLWWGFIRNPDHFIPLITFGYSSLIGITSYIIVDIIVKNYSKIKDLVKANLSQQIYLKVSSIILIMLVLMGLSIPWIAYSGYPVNGNLGGRLMPIVVPEEYNLLNKWMSDEQGYRSWWLPQPLGHTWFTWAPQNPRTSAWPQVVSSRPILWGSTTYSSNFLNYIYLQEVLEGKTRNLGKVLSPAGVKYFAVHLDMFPQGASGFNDEPNRLLQNLLRQRDLRPVNNYSFVYLFESTATSPPVYIAPSLGVVVGGLDTYTALAELEDFNPNDIALVFADQLNSLYLRELLGAANFVFFHDGTGLEDLYLQLADDSFIYPASYTQFERSPDITWTKTSSLLIYLHMAGVQSGKHFVQSGGFPIAQSLVYTQAGGARMEVPIMLKEQGEYELWARILLSPIGSRLKISIDDLTAKEINTNSTIAYLKWVKVYDGYLAGKQHTITLENEHGVNFVNVFAIVQKSRAELLRHEVKKVLQNKSVVLVNRTLIAKPLNIVDQESSPERIDANWVWKNGEEIIAQTFVPEKAQLSGIEVLIGRVGDAGKLVVELRETDNKTGFPSGKALSKLVLDSNKIHPVAGTFYFFPFNQSLIVGKKYAIVFSQEGGSPDSYWYVGRSPWTDVYSNGNMLMSSDGGKSWTNTTADIAFKTFYPEFIETSNLQESQGSTVTLFLWDVNTGEKSRLNRLPTKNQIAYILNYSMPYPGKYVVKVNSQGPFSLIIAENYNDYWSISGVKSYMHYPAYSFLNGYYINETRVFEITIEYSLNKPFEIGKWFSISFLIGVLALLILIETHVIDKIRFKNLKFANNNAFTST